VDVELRQGLWQFIRRYNAEGRTVILTTHYLEEAEELCERIAILQQGKIVALDRKENLLSAASWRILKVTFDHDPGELGPALEDLLTGASENIRVFRIDAQRNPLGAVLAQLQQLPAQILDLHLQEPRLEDAFTDILGRMR
jgi:ABC-2 type transport system ATP-binding protein